MWSPEQDFNISTKENFETPSTPSHGKWYGPCTPQTNRRPGSPRESPRLSLTMFAKTPRISFGKVKIGSNKVKRVVIDNPLSIAQSLHLDKWPESKGFTILKPVGHGEACQNFDVLGRSVEFVIPGMSEMDLHIMWKPNAEGSYRELVTIFLGDFNRLNLILFGNAVDTTVKPKPKMKTLLPEDIRKCAVLSSQKRKISKTDKQSTSSVRSKRILRESNAGLPEPKPPDAMNTSAASMVKPIIKLENKVKGNSTTGKFKAKFAAKGIAPKRLTLTKHLASERSLPRHPLPYAAKNMYYDERWIEKQERGFVQWLNYVLTPPDELAMSVQADTSSIFSNNATTGRQHLAPTKEALSLRAYTAKRKMARLRHSACLLYQSPPVALVAKTIEGEVERNRLTIRADKHFHQDLGIKETMVKMLLSYNSLWLRIGLETIYGEVLPLNSNNDVAGLKRFLKRRFLANPDIAKEYRYTTAAEYYRPGYYDALKKFTLKKFLLLILFLDKAKLTRLIDHDPCLFNKNADYKSSRVLLLSFSRDYLKGEGDVTKHLGLLKYIVTHEQLPLDEMDYAVTNLAVDLRNGLRITRVIELLTQNWCLSASLRVPAISRLQKIHNVDIALSSLKEQGVLAEELNSVNPRHIVDGHREKTLSLLWMIILHFQVNQVVNEQQIKEEIAFLRKYYNQKNPNLHQAISEQIDDVYSKSPKLSLLLEWCRSVCRLYGVKVDNFTVSMSDGRIMCYLLHFYHPSLLREEDICQETTQTCNPYTIEDDSLNSEDESLTHDQDESSARISRLKGNEKRNHELLREKVKELGGVPSMLRFADLSCTIPDEKVIITYLSYLCARLLDLRLEGRAARVIQLAWRKYREEQRTKEIKRRNKAAFVIQKCVRLFLENKGQQVLLYSAIIIQAYVRGYQARRNLGHRQHAASVIQSFYRSYRITQETRHEFTNLKQVTLRMQSLYRGKIARRHVRKIKAARLIQSHWRGYSARRTFLALKRSTVMIQTEVRKFLARRCYQKLQAASVVIQRRYKAKLLARKTRKEFINFKKVVTRLQAFHRGNFARNEVRGIRAAIVLQKSVKMWLCRREFLKRKSIVTKLQAIVRRNIARRKYKTLVSAATVIQERWKACRQGVVARKEYRQLKTSSVIIQSYYRQHTSRKQYLSTRKSVILVQALVRGLLVRRDIRRKAKASSVIQRYFRSYQLMKKTAEEYRKIKVSAVKTQALWRGKTTRLQFRRQKSAIVSAQAKIRGTLTRKQFLRTKSAVILLQVRYRAQKQMHRQRQVYMKTRDAIITLQAAIRGYLVRQELKRINSAATCIQAYYRCFSTRARYLQLQHCVLVIQRQYRARRLGRQVALAYKRARNAAIVIQKYARGMRVRDEVRRMNKAAVRIQASYKRHREQKAYSALSKATVNMQQRYRATRKARVARKDYLLKRQSVIRLQSALRGAIYAKYYQSQKQAARVIQTRWRAVLCSRKAKEEYHCVRGSVITIQAFARGLKARNEAKRERASIKIQAWWKGVVKRQSFQETRNATVTLQACFRMLAARRKYEGLKTTVVHLQRLIRANQLCRSQTKVYQITREAVITLQAAVRGYRVRKELKIMNEAATRIQASFRKCFTRREYLKTIQSVLVIQRRRQATMMCRQAKFEYQSLRCSVTLLQSQVRGFLARRNFQESRRKIVLLQSCIRRFQARQNYLRTRKAVLTIQQRYRAYIHGSTVKKLYDLQRGVCITLQAGFRAWVCRQRYLKLRKSTTIIQIYYRAKVIAKEQRQGYLDLRRAVLSIQAFTRGWLVRREVKRYRAATLIQSSWRMCMAREWYTHQRQRIIQAQSFVRMWSCRRRYAALQETVVTVQRRYRAKLLCRRERDLFMEMKGSCLMIQHCYRFYRQRRLVKEMLKSVSTLRNAALVIQRRFRANQLARSTQQEYLTQRRATILLQATYRGYQARVLVARLRAAIVIQSVYRGYRQRSEYSALRNATIKMQALARGKETCKEFNKLRAAAIVIQRRQRAYIQGYLQRQIFLVQKNSAIVIQSFFRGYKTRTRYEELKRAAIKVQSLVRAYMARNAFLNLRTAAIIIQSRERARILGLTQRTSFMILKKYSIFLQSRFRGKRERARFLQKKNAVVKLQSLARGKRARISFERTRKATIVLQRRERARVTGKRERERFVERRRSVILIQSTVRGHQQRTRYLELQHAVVTMQAHVRRKAARGYYQKLRAAAIVLQRRERARVIGKLTREVFLEQRKSVILIQSCVREYQQRTRFCELRHAAIVVQACVRRKHVRDTFLRMRNATIVIQRKQRARLLGKRQRKNFQKQRRSAVLIQSVTRCYQQRTWYLQLRNAATIVQARVRGKGAYYAYQKLRQAAVVIQRRERARILGKLERESFLARRRCAILIQSWVRGCKERQRFYQLKNATVTIQAVVRGYQQRRKHIEMKLAAICIQERYRAFKLGREVLHRYEKIKNAAIVIQSYHRGHCARQFVKRILASIAIQAAYRRHLARRRYLRLRKATVYLQSLQRMRHKQRRYKELRNTTIKLQRRVKANQLGQKVMAEYHKTRNSIIHLQAIWRGFKARENVRRIKSARVIQRRYRAYVEGRRVRIEFVLVKRAVIRMQACYRGNVARKQFKRERAARTIQAHVRGYQARELFKKLQEVKAARLFRFSSAVYVNLMAMRLQRGYRKARAIASFRAKMDRLVFLQRWWRAKLQRLSYLRMRYLVCLVQRRWRARLAVKNLSASRIQAVVRAFLAKRAAERRKEAILIIQCAWRGYRIRRRYNTKKFKKARLRILVANSNVTEHMKLCNRTRSSLDYLLRCKNLTTIREALVHLEVASRLSRKCTEQLVMENALSVIFKVVRDSNRSLAHMGLIKLALDIFINVSKCPTTKDAVVKEANSLDTLVELACIFREKHEIFLKLTKLLTILCENNEIRESLLGMEKAVSKMKSIYTITKRKHDLEMKRNTAKAKQLTMSTQKMKKTDNISTIDLLSAITKLMETLILHV